MTERDAARLTVALAALRAAVRRRIDEVLARHSGNFEPAQPAARDRAPGRADPPRTAVPPSGSPPPVGGGVRAWVMRLAQRLRT